MSDAPSGRPRDVHLDQQILAATRDLLAEGNYAELSMEGVAARARVGKKTLYRRWPSKASLVAAAVLDAYGRGESFAVADTGDIRADLRTWLVEHATFVGNPLNAALMKGVIAASAANATEGAALYQQLSAPQHEGLVLRLRNAAKLGHVAPTADIGAIADALIGTLLLHTLAQRPNQLQDNTFDGLLNALLDGSLGNGKTKGVGSAS